MQKLILIVSLVAGVAQAQKTPPKPIALFLDCNIGTHYSNAIAPSMKKRGEEMIVVPCKDFQKTMDKLAKENVYIKTLFASGHDGDGSVYADDEREATKGKFDPYIDIDAVNKKYPKLFAQVQTYYPLGCYTTAMGNVRQYLEVMPNIKFIAGYFGAAHSAHRQKSQNYLVEMVNKEDAIIQAVTVHEFQKLTSNLETMKTDMNIGMFRNLTCKTGETKGYMLEVDHGGDAPVNRAVIFSKDTCKKIKTELQKKTDEYFKYSEGEIDVPIATSGGPVRELYSYFRQNEYCYDIVKDDKDFQNFPSASEVFSLLFHRNFQRNFKLYYQKKMNALKAQIKQQMTSDLKSASALKEAYDQINTLSTADLGSWNVKKVNEISVALQATSQKLQKTMTCTSQTNCLKKEFTHIADEYSKFVGDRMAPDEWHSYTAGKMPMDPHYYDE